MARARPIPGVAPGASFREAAANAVQVRTEELFSFAEGVLDTGDIERVHDMRVASRRLRAVMEVFAPAFPKGAHKRALRDVKALADDLGERRDPDVAIAALERVAGSMTVDDRPGVEYLVGQLGTRQQSANERLAERLELVETSDLEQRLLALVAGARVG